MEVEYSSEHLSSNIRLFHVKRVGSPIGSLDYVAGVVCVLGVVVQVLKKQRISPTDPWLVFCLGLVIFRVAAVLNTICEGREIKRGMLRCFLIRSLESLLVVNELGVQITRKSYIGKESHIFIEKDKITSIVVSDEFFLVKSRD
jgi:hypothetical protein